MPTSASRLPPTSRSTSVIRAVPGSAAQTRTPTACCVSTSREEPTSRASLRVIGTRLPCGSINVRERPWASKRRPIDYKRCCTDRLNAQPLMRHFQSGKIIHRRPDGHYYMSKYGAGHFQVHRADLHNALKAAVLANDSDCVHLAHTFNRLLLEMKGIAHSVFLEDCCTLPDQMPFVLTFPWRR